MFTRIVEMDLFSAEDLATKFVTFRSRSEVFVLILCEYFEKNIVVPG